jgi:hypothetical protein
MRYAVLSVILSTALIACDRPPTADPCLDSRFVESSRSAPSLDSIPADSLVSALLAWDGGVPRGKGDELRALGVEVVYEFQFQPAILVGATGVQLRTLAASDPTVEIKISVIFRDVLFEDCR